MEIFKPISIIDTALALIKYTALALIKYTALALIKHSVQLFFNKARSVQLFFIVTTGKRQYLPFTIVAFYSYIKN